MRRDVALPEGRALRVVAIADTHGRPHPEAARRVAEASPDLVLHAGDVGDLACLDAFAAIAPLVAVRGNIDGRELPDVVVVDVNDGASLLLRLLLIHQALAGPRLVGEAATLGRADGVRLVVCGHSHVPFLGDDRGIAVLNPGSIGPRRFALPIVFGTLDVSRERVVSAHVSVETGARWTP